MKMELPVSKKRMLIKWHICKYPGCGDSFKGHPRRLYCDTHKDPKERPLLHKDRRRIPTDPGKDNWVFKHEYHMQATVRHNCALDGCQKEFTIRVIPKQYIYPKYCTEHRSEFKRKIFKETA